MKPLFRFLLMSLLPFTLAASAQASFSIMPMEVQHKVSADENRISDEIEIHNGGNAPVHISGAIVDWKLTDDGDYQYSEATDNPQSCASWIELSPKEFNVAPKKSVRVRYTITAPQTLTNERHAMIFFLSRPLPAKNSQGVGLMVATRMGCKVFVSPAQPLTKSAQISDISLQNTPQPRLKVSVKNTASTTFRSTGTIEVRNESGSVVAQGQLSSAQVLPDAQRNLWFDLATPLPVGSYTIKTTVDYGVKQLLGGELKTKVTEENVTEPTVAPVSSTQNVAPDATPKSVD